MRGNTQSDGRPPMYDKRQYLIQKSSYSHILCSKTQMFVIVATRVQQ